MKFHTFFVKYQGEGSSGNKHVPLNNEKDTNVHCHFIIIISQKTRSSTNWQPCSPISILVYPVPKTEQWCCKPPLPLPVFNKFN